MKKGKILICAALLAGFACTAQAKPALKEAAPLVLTQERIAENFPEQETTTSSAEALNGKQKTLSVPVTSWRDIPFKTVKKQALDYSCGSAALSTLLTYVYGDKTSEGSIFKAMFSAGDKEKIRKDGFSLLDMSNYLNEKGYKAVGYKVTLNLVEEKNIPFVALINSDGYNHFVVVKSIRGGQVLVGDPSKGNMIYSRDVFEKIWNGIALIVTNHADKARNLFKNNKEWTYTHSLARPGDDGNSMGVDRASLNPIPWQIAPTNINLIDTSSLTSSLSP